MKKLVLALTAAMMLAPTAPALADPPSRAEREYRKDVREARKDYRKDVREARRDRREAYRDWNRYDYNRPDPRYGRYDAGRYYRDGRYYQPRRLAANDRIYRGSNGNYYCRRDDGTTGLIIGAVGGGILGNVIAPGDSKTLGTILGGGLGAIAGRAIDRDGVRCR